MTTLSLSTHKFWCPQCQRHFSRLSSGELHTTCPSCGTLSREVSSEDYMRRVLDSFIGDNEFQRRETPNNQMSEETNPLMEEIARRRPSSENSTSHIVEEPALHSNTSNDTLTSETEANESSNLHMPPPTQAQTEGQGGQPRRRLMLIHTIFISGPHGGIIIRTGHMLPDNVQNGSEMVPESNSEEQEAHSHAHDPMHDHDHNHEHEHEHHHHHGLLDFLGRLNPLNLLRGNRPQMERTHSQDQEAQPTENEPLGLHHAHSDTEHPEEPFQGFPRPGVRILLNPHDLFSNGFMGLDQLLSEIFRGMPEHEGAPPATEEALSHLKEFEYQPDKESDLCAICHDDFAEKQKVSQLPCEHMYHKDCVTKWLKMHNICPMCRSPIQEEGQAIPQS